ncbi:MAG: winged helix-turn-helix transcriptional regulator [Pyrinomonadaceae bacterium]|nr:winged helix-turn-helix transcriptional regulator [Phycisphaerales bacterium]
MMTQASKHWPSTPKRAAACCRPIDKLLNPELFKALCDPTRVSLISCIAKCGRGCSVGEVAQCCSVDFSVVSRHLSLLAKAGVLEAQKQGRTVFYRVRYTELCQSLRLLADAIEDCCPDAAGCCGDGGRGACC